MMENPTDHDTRYLCKQVLRRWRNAGMVKLSGRRGYYLPVREQAEKIMR